MEASPLTQQARPDVFQQKVVKLYEALFHDEDVDDKSEGFWTELFLLRPDQGALRRILGEVSPDELLSLHEQTRTLFLRAIAHMKAGSAPSDGNALDTLTTFLSSVLTKKYTNPSSDIINVLAGLDQVDSVFTEFVSVLDGLIRTGRSLDIRQKSIEVALSVIAGAYQTSLLSYFTHRDLFPSLMKFILESDSHSRVFEPFVLLGLLANYNKFEFQNSYRLRLEDFVNETAIQKIVRSIGSTCSDIRKRYIDIQDDLPEGWSLVSAFGIFGLGGLVGSKPKPTTIDPEAAKEMFAKLPGAEAAVLLATYDFAHANKLFCFTLVTLEAENKQTECPIVSFISVTSYLLQHAYASTRTSVYSKLNLITIRLLLEDQVLCKRICSEDSKATVRLCRQRSPYLPLVQGQRTLSASILDTMVDGINHNLRRRLDIDLYNLFIGIILRTVSYLSRSRTRLDYHWSELFRSLLTLVRFLATYATDMTQLTGIESLLDNVVNLIALSLSAGESFLPTPAAYDDLFYKLVETGEILTKFSAAYDLSKRPNSSIGTLVSVSAHYKDLLKDGVKGNSVKHLTSAQVAQVIKQGYDSLDIQTKEGLDAWERYREADEKTILKKAARVAVWDAKGWLDGL